MKFISWNLQKATPGRTSPSALLPIFDKHQADVVLIQEPSKTLIEWGNGLGKDEKTPRGCHQPWKAWTYDGGEQGTIVVLTRGDVSVSGLQPKKNGAGNPPVSLNPKNKSAVGQGTKKIEKENHFHLKNHFHPLKDC